MTNVYSKEFLEKYDIIDEKYADNKNPNAKQIRDKRARQFRKLGYTVETEKFNVFGDTVFTLFAKRDKKTICSDTFTKIIEG